MAPFPRILAEYLPDMIKSVHFTGFRSLKDVELRLGPLTALVGPNATGKSTVLRGLAPEFVAQDSTEFWQRDTSNRLCRRLTTDTGAVTWWGFRDGSSRWYHDDGSYRTQNLHLDVQALRTANSVQEAQFVSRSGANLANAIATLPRRLQAELSAAYCRLVPVFADVDVRPSPSKAGTHRVVFQDRWREDVWYEPGEVSDGSMLMLAFSVLPFQSSVPDLLTIEEPEHGLHPYLLRQLVDLLRRLAHGEHGGKPIQVVIATHSAELLEHLRPEEVRFLSRNDDGSVRIEEAPVDDPEWKSVYDEYQRSLGGLWLSGNLGGVPGSAA
jgi:predicted ATPase